MVSLVEIIYNQYRDNTGKEKGEIKMKGRKSRRSWMCLALMGVAALIIAIIPSPALTQTCPSAVDCSQNPSTACDADADGISDYDECNGIYLYDGTPYTRCQNPGDLATRNDCLDPNSRDLFVILVPAVGSLIPADPMEFVYRSKSSGGLGLATHMITASQADSERYFGYRDQAKTIQIQQKAARVTESLNTGNLIILGVAEYGTPNGLDDATVYTQRIQGHIMNVCGSRYDTANCVDTSSQPLKGAALVERYIKHTIAHEIGHMITLTTQNQPRFDGHHYKSGSQVILEQAVAYTDKSQKVTFYLSDTFLDSADYTGIHLK